MPVLDLRPYVDDPRERTAEWAHALAASDEFVARPPGRGATTSRWRLLADLGSADLDLARLLEAHLDALAILADLGATELVRTGELWGVWAANPPHEPLRAARRDDRWSVEGVKPWCSGAGTCDRALVTAEAEDGYRMFAVDLHEGSSRPVDGTWPSAAMAGSDSRSTRFDHTAAVPVGSVDDYLDRPGFWHGAVGVAAVWWGGARGVARALARAHARRPLNTHALAHAGAVDASLTGAWALLADAGALADEDPADEMGVARLTAGRVRAVVEQVALEVVEHVGKALGPAPLATDVDHARRVSDLLLYLRQSHAERDLEELGRASLAIGRDPWTEPRR